MELPVCLFVGLLDPHDPLHALVKDQIVRVQMAGVAHQTKDRAAHAVGDAHLQALDLQFVGQRLDTFPAGARLHDYDHNSLPLSSA